MRRTLSIFFLVGLGWPVAGCQVTAPTMDGDPLAPSPAAEPEVQPEAPEPTPPHPAALDLPSDTHCIHPRRARPDPTSAGNPAGELIVEHLDDQGCVAVRSTQTVMGRTTRIEVEVPGDPQWFRQPPAYVDLTPRPLVTTVTVDALGREVERTRDLGADGTIDERMRQVWQGEYLIEQTREGEQWSNQRWAYDARGNQVRAETEFADHQTVVERDFDAQDRMLVERIMQDGAVRSTHTWRYDGAHLIEDHLDSVGRVEVTRFTYDADGMLLRREWRRTQGGTGVVVELHDFTQNAAGETVQHYRRDNRGDGQIEEQRWITRDSQGRERLVEHDDDANGSVDWSREQRWDDDGRRVWWRNMRNGVPILLKTWTFGDVFEQTEWPASRGARATRITRTWQDGDAQITEVSLEDGEETLQSRVVTHYVTPDVIGEATTDRDGDGIVDVHLRQTVDALGRITRVDWVRDGVVSWRTLEYDALGELATEIGTLPSGGEARLLRQFVRDVSGNVLYSHALRHDGESAFRIVSAFN